MEDESCVYDSHCRTERKTATEKKGVRQVNGCLITIDLTGNIGRTLLPKESSLHQGVGPPGPKRRFQEGDNVNVTDRRDPRLVSNCLAQEKEEIVTRQLQSWISLIDFLSQAL